MRIVQVAPEIGPGSGVGGVAHHLEAAWRRAGVETARFTLDDAGGRRLPAPGPGLRGRLALAARVVWFSTAGSLRCARRPGRRPDDVVVVHNDVLGGDVYVNHGLLLVAMRARGGAAGRLLRNPLHLFTTARDAVRYRLWPPAAIVCLTAGEAAALHRLHPRTRDRTVVVPNGVDTDRFRPPTPAERAAARERAGVPDGALHLVFVGHEPDRKGLYLALGALARLPGARLTAVGGTADVVATVRRRAAALGVADRVATPGVADPLPYLAAADALVLPSAYEANALVVLEALACGVPVVATPVGHAPAVVRDGVTGYLVERSEAGVLRGVRALAALDDAGRERLRAGARAVALEHTWDAVAARYLEALRRVRPDAARDARQDVHGDAHGGAREGAPGGAAQGEAPATVPAEEMR
ncbi:glycosyltransferase family 4 protein [Puerhibacterium sp. TATVAM-FAB25]|uniref:glycosyltransferase family 4 protein n=1 Tax=Puerhibacterium sp. TATVAM-FAB25 TaxID=3093699 RepID=UPI00397BBB08